MEREVVMSPVHVGTSVFNSWKSIYYPPAGWTDTFIFNMPVNAGLPPDEYAEVARMLTWQIKKLRRGAASLWVQVEGPGQWYAREVRRVLKGETISIAVTSSEIDQPDSRDFWPPPPTIKTQSPPPPEVERWNLGDLSNDALACDRVLARVGKGYTSEIAALTGLGIDTARKTLRLLVEQKYANYVTDYVTPAAPKQEVLIGDKSFGRVDPGQKKSYPFWEINRNGTSIALRSWGLPPDYYFPQRKEFREPMDSRHRKVSRQWPAWVKKAWPHSEVWTGWSEVHIKGLDTTPDALAWGKVDNYETLFWLEVESGHSSTKVIEKKINRRLNRAAMYAEGMKVHLVFVLLAMPWVQGAARSALVNLPDHVACVTSDWKEFGELPVVEWSKVRMGIR